MNSLSVPSFSKINWFLKVLGRRPDGFHEIATVFQTIDLCDKIRFEQTSGNDISVQTRGRRVAAGKDNILFRTARLIQEATRVKSGVQITLTKNIPVGAGLGGGSGNAAMGLLALNRLWDCHLSMGQLQNLASEIGSDVPFFLSGGTGLGVGRGEIVTPLEDACESSLILLYPKMQVSTREAYQIGQWGPVETLPELTKQMVDNRISRFRRAVEKGLPVEDFLENDFDNPVMAQYPPLTAACDELKRAGCEKVCLCGSGSTLLGMAAPDRVVDIAKDIADRNIGEVYLLRTLSRERYRSLLGESGLSL